jgi:ferredoxin
MTRIIFGGQSILMSEIPERLRPQVEDAARLCPRQALKIEG